MCGDLKYSYKDRSSLTLMNFAFLLIYLISGPIGSFMSLFLWPNYNPKDPMPWLPYRTEGELMLEKLIQLDDGSMANTEYDITKHYGRNCV